MGRFVNEAGESFRWEKSQVRFASLFVKSIAVVPGFGGEEECVYGGCV